MKKLMCAVAAMAAGAAMAEGIASANIVGYDTESGMQQNKYFMMGAQFETPSGTPIKLSEINWGFDLAYVPAYGGGYKAVAPQLQVLPANGTTVTPYYYASRTNSKTGITSYYWFTDAGKSANDVTIDPGIGFWYRDPSPSPTYTFSGSVMTDSPWERTYQPGAYNMLVSPYPKQITLADLTFSNADETAPLYDGSSYKTTAMQIQIQNFDTTACDPYYYAKRLNKKTGEYAYYWFDNSGKAKDASSVIIPAGRACWFRAANTEGAEAVKVSLSL